jgi:hypothetical protein
MNLSRILAFVLLLIAIAIGVFAYQQAGTLAQTQAQMATLEGVMAERSTALAIEAFALAQDVQQQQTLAADDLAEVREAAATLQAGSIATRSALGDVLGELSEVATADAVSFAEAVIEAQATQTAFAAFAAEQDAQILELAAAGTLSADALATQNASFAALQGELAESLTQVAVVAAQATAQNSAAAATPIPVNIAAGERPFGNVSAAALIADEDFQTGSTFPIRAFPNSGRTQIVNGQYVFVLDANPQAGITTLGTTSYRDILVQVEVFIESCAPGSLLLIEIRANSARTEGYALGADCSLQNWGIFERGENGAELLIVEEFTTVLLGSGAPHIFAVEARGSALSFYVDGVRLGGIEDESFSEGAIGFTVISDAAARIRLDNLRIWEAAPAPVIAAVTPTPVAPVIAIGYDSNAERDAFAAVFPASLTGEISTWMPLEAPQLGGDNATFASAAWFMESESGLRAVAAFIFSGNPEELAAVVAGAQQQLMIVPLAESPNDFPLPNIFGIGRDGIEGVWVQGNVLVRATLLSSDENNALALIEFARLLRDLLPED